MSDLPDHEVINMLCVDEWGFSLGMCELRVHPRRTCQPPCPIHAPSDHHMVTWTQVYRADRHMMERTCPHGIGHPDPDDRSLDKHHGCDRCCLEVVGDIPT